MDASAAPAPPKVRSIQRAFAILAVVAHGPVGVTEIATATRLAKSTVSRLLETLEVTGAVTREADARYRLGPAIRDLAAIESGGQDLRAIALPELERLAASVGEAVGLSIAEGAGVLYIGQVSPQHEVQVRDWTGTTAPMHAVSSGHVFLARMSTGEVRALLPTRLEALTAQTITRRSELERRLADVRRAGYAWVRDEFADGISSVAAAVLGAGGVTVAAIHIHGPTYRFPRRGAEAAIAAEVMASATRLTERLDRP